MDIVVCDLRNAVHLLTEMFGFVAAVRSGSNENIYIQSIYMYIDRFIALANSKIFSLPAYCSIDRDAFVAFHVVRSSPNY